jgi:predicted HicB family RNase H-like nuclease
MSKDILKRSQEARKNRKESGEEEDRTTTDSMRQALLDSEARDEGPTKRLNAQIPSRLHQRFKDACKAEGKSMTDVLVQLVETYIDLKEE